VEVLTLLCIDDRPQRLEVRKSLLESYGYRVRTAFSGDAAMMMLQHTRVAAVLLEYKTEDMDAEVVASRIKLQCPSIPIILLSTYADMPERMLWSVDEYVMKSEVSDSLIPAIERVTGHEIRKPRSLGDAAA
jgi:CheY-like chemotaxis protein